MFNLLGKITESVQANFHFLNRYKSPSSRTKVFFNAPVSFQAKDSSSIKAVEAASDLWESIVENMSESRFIIEQGIDRKWLSDQLRKTDLKFERYRIHFPPSLIQAFHSWLYEFQVAFRTKDLYETYKCKDRLETEIKKIIENKE